MREFKFRVWDNKNKIMYHPDNCYNCYISLDGSVELFKEILYDTYMEEKDCEIMQSIEMKDIMGIDIFEGDNVKVLSDPEWIGEVSVRYGSFGIENNIKGHFTFLFDISDSFEIIGNIYEQKVYIG